MDGAPQRGIRFRSGTEAGGKTRPAARMPLVKRRRAMAAMIGADETAVRRLAADTDVDIANLNAPGQIVISGESAKVELA